MADTVSSYRIRTDVGQDSGADYITIDANLVQEYDTLDILSVKIRSNDTYRLHNADYGVVVGRVIANNGFGIPNAKLSIFIASDGEDGEKVRTLYPFTSSASKNSDGVRYNLLPDEKVGDCHQIVGTFPNKRYALDNDVILEVFDKYYKYTTRSNNAGDFLIMGVPTGSHTLHMDLDLSDCGILSQRPRDFVYKGYTVEQFENPNMFKSGTTYQNLSQIFTQDRTVNVKPLWGNSSLGEELGITRADIDVAFVFETTCVFMGSVISDNSSQGITKKCMGTENMGNMEEMVTGEGTIEMIRKTPAGNVEEFQVKGTQLIDADGVWCYQIPMNLDYMMTDEYGNMVPTDDPSKGVATRARVRLRMSMSDTEENVDNYFRAKALVPHNPQLLSDGTHEDYDYEFGTYTREDSYRDLFWNNVYSVKSYIPRFQKRKVLGWKDRRFVAIKNCNFHGTNNPMPYNNIRIRLPFMFGVMCVIVKCLIWIVGLWNFVLAYVIDAVSSIASALCGFWSAFKGTGERIFNKMNTWSFSVLKDGLCPDLDNWYFAPMLSWHYYVADTDRCDCDKPDPFGKTLERIVEGDGLGSSSGSGVRDLTSIDETNVNDYENAICLTTKVDYLLSCVEMNLAMEYRVINFDFYNDWVNGTIYFPRFMRFIKPKLRFLGITWRQAKTKGCMDDPSVFSKTRRYTQQCAIGYGAENINGRVLYTRVQNPMPSKQRAKEANRLHKAAGFSQITIFGGQGGICHEQKTLQGQNVYYMKPCEFRGHTGNERKINLFATDIILLGSLNDCDRNGIPQAFRYLSSTSYVLPTNLALTNMEENGMLYATDDGTICRGGEQKNYIDTSGGNDGETDVSTPIQVKPQNDGLTGEITYFSGGGADVNLEYDTYELSDLIALTEAAGISWNFTGPGQGDPVDDYMYAPGGHFLGLSCVNAQSNMKSCINLTRICELGANMSQRKEEVFDLDNKGNLKYKYTAPSGFISGNDIVGEDFRAMFATMNHRRLIADRTDPETGYKVYGFDFVHPINFNGAFTEPVNTSSSPYNQTIEVPREDDDVFEELGISTGSGNGRADYDKDEGNNTQIRTVESPDIDYYMFRMGLDYDDLTRNSLRHVNRFLAGTSAAMNINTGTKLYVPQYENSFYFYFGLNVGATAIEKFNEQFFSVCATDGLLTSDKTINLSIDGEVMACKGEADIRVVTNNLTTPYERILYYMEGAATGMTVDGTTSKGKQWLNQYVFTIENLELGTWTVEITDAEGSTVSSSINLTNHFVSFEVEKYDFNLVSSMQGIEMVTDLGVRGGYIEIIRLNIAGLPDTVKTVGVTLVDDDGKTVDTGIIVFDSEFGSTSLPLRLKVEKANKIHTLRIAYICNGESVGPYSIYSFSLKDGSGAELVYRNQSMGVEIPLTYIQEMQSKMAWEYFDGTRGDYAWETKLCTFNEINPSALGSESFSTNIVCKNGNKALWGSPQNTEGTYRFFYSYPVYCTERYDEIPEGYALDDETAYWSTYTYERLGRDKKCPGYFSAIGYKGNMVYGIPFAQLLESGAIEALPIPNYFIENQEDVGYVFKPLPDGDLQFYELESADLNKLKYNSDNGRITKGLFYGAFVYPIFSRPFYIEGDVYKTCRIYFPLSDATETTFPIIVSNSWQEVNENQWLMRIHNGITYGDDFKFGIESFMRLDTTAAVEWTASGDGIFKAEVDDLYGVNLTHSIDRITTLSGWVEYGGEESIGANYGIYNGHPENIDGTLLNNIQGDISMASRTTFIATELDGYLMFAPLKRIYDNHSFDEMEISVCIQNSHYENDGILTWDGGNKLNTFITYQIMSPPIAAFYFLYAYVVERISDGKIGILGVKQLIDINSITLFSDWSTLSNSSLYLLDDFNGYQMECGVFPGDRYSNISDWISDINTEFLFLKYQPEISFRNISDIGSLIDRYKICDISKPVYGYYNPFTFFSVDIKSKNEPTPDSRTHGVLISNTVVFKPITFFMENLPYGDVRVVPGKDITVPPTGGTQYVWIVYYPEGGYWPQYAGSTVSWARSERLENPENYEGGAGHLKVPIYIDAYNGGEGDEDIRHGHVDFFVLRENNKKMTVSVTIHQRKR